MLPDAVTAVRALIRRTTEVILCHISSLIRAIDDKESRARVTSIRAWLQENMIWGEESQQSLSESSESPEKSSTGERKLGYMKAPAAQSLDAIAE